MSPFRLIFPLMIALALFVALAVSIDIPIGDVVSVLRGFPVIAMAGVIGATAVFILLSALKWRMVVREVSGQGNGIKNWGFYLFYTSLGAALSLVTTVHASMAVSRAIGVKRHLGQSALSGAAGSLFEQLFDVGVLLQFALAGFVTLAFGHGVFTWIALSIAFCVLSGGLLAVVSLFRQQLLPKLSRLPVRFNRKLSDLLQWFAEPSALRIFSPGFVLGMYALSLARYLVLMLRAFIVLWAVNAPVAWTDFPGAFSLVQLSKLISITPAGLGITEWTWSGIWLWMGYPIETTIPFILANRVFGSLSLIIVLAVVYLAAVLAPRVLASGEATSSASSPTTPGGHPQNGTAG